MLYNMPAWPDTPDERESMVGLVRLPENVYRPAKPTRCNGWASVNGKNFPAEH